MGKELTIVPDHGAVVFETRSPTGAWPAPSSGAGPTNPRQEKGPWSLARHGCGLDTTLDHHASRARGCISQRADRRLTDASSWPCVQFECVMDMVSAWRGCQQLHLEHTQDTRRARSSICLLLEVR